MANPKAKDLEKINKYARGVKKLNAFTLKYLNSIASAGLTETAMSSIYKGTDIGQGRNSLKASELKRLAPTKLDKMEGRILKMLTGLSIQDIEWLLVHRVLPEAKRRTVYSGEASQTDA